MEEGADILRAEKINGMGKTRVKNGALVGLAGGALPLYCKVESRVSNGMKSTGGMKVPSKWERGRYQRGPANFPDRLVSANSSMFR